MLELVKNNDLICTSPGGHQLDESTRFRRLIKDRREGDEVVKTYFSFCLCLLCKQQIFVESEVARFPINPQ